MECTRCPLKPIVEAVSQLTNTISIPASFVNPKARRDERTEVNAAEYLAFRYATMKTNERRNGHPVMLAAKKLAPALSKIAADLEAAMPLFQNVCLACSRSSDDDNPSNKGQVFVSLDAMASQGLSDDPDDPAAVIDAHDRAEREGRAPDDADPAAYDDEEVKSYHATGDWLSRNTVRDVHSLSPNGGTTLPPGVEDKLRMWLKAFSDLCVFDQFLVLSQMHENGLNFAEFGTMKWVPKEMKSPQSKQFVSARWDRICRTLPIAEALRKKKPISKIQNAMTTRYSEVCAQNMEFDFGV